MKRRLFDAGALISLLLCLAATALWLLGPWDRPQTRLPGGARVGLVARWIMVSTVRRPLLITTLPSPDTYRAWRFAGIFVDRFRTGPHRGWTVMVPLAYPALLGALPPALWITRRLRERRRAARAHEICSTCGYDLRGTPGSESCPECGAASGGWEAKA